MLDHLVVLDYLNQKNCHPGIQPLSKKPVDNEQRKLFLSEKRLEKRATLLHMLTRHVGSRIGLFTKYQDQYKLN